MPFGENNVKQKLEKRHRRNKMGDAVSLLNKYHSLILMQLTDQEITFVKNHVRRELKKMKNDLPDWFSSSIPYWLEDREAWFNR